MTVDTIEAIHAGYIEMCEKELVDSVWFRLNNSCDLAVGRFELYYATTGHILVSFYDRAGWYIGSCLDNDIDDIHVRLK